MMSTAADGEEALDTFRKADPDLVVLDVMMPKLDGYGVCQELRKESDVPIIMLTALGDVADRITGLELGADDYVVKPFSPKERSRIRSATGGQNGHFWHSHFWRHPCDESENYTNKRQGIQRR